jgi:hypothetical protein
LAFCRHPNRAGNRADIRSQSELGQVSKPPLEAPCLSSNDPHNENAKESSYGI